MENKIRKQRFDRKIEYYWVSLEALLWTWHELTLKEVYDLKIVFVITYEKLKSKLKRTDVSDVDYMVDTDPLHYIYGQRIMQRVCMYRQGPMLNTTCRVHYVINGSRVS